MRLRRYVVPSVWNAGCSLSTMTFRGAEGVHKAGIFLAGDRRGHLNHWVPPSFIPSSEPDVRSVSDTERSGTSSAEGRSI